MPGEEQLHRDTRRGRDVGGIALPHDFEPLARELVSERAIALREHRVGGLADESVPERVLLLPRKAPFAPLADDLSIRELVEPLADFGRMGLAAEQERYSGA